MNEIKYKKGVGLDLGTNAIVRARLVETDEVVTTWIRDAFLNLKPTNKIVQNTMRKGLEKAGISFLEKDDCFIIIGDDALNAAVERGLTTQRPMSKGVVSPREAQALPIFKVLIKKVLGTPVEENEVCVYSVPASPVDAPFDSDFHSSMINAILKDLGYKGVVMNEAQAIVYSELDDQDYTGIALSFGAGMVNVCISNGGEPVAVFATSKSGDYVDEKSAIALGYDSTPGVYNEVTPSTVQLTKETCHLDLTSPDPEDKSQQAICTYYQSLMNYTIDNIVYQLKKLNPPPKFTQPIVMVVSGGTSKPKGFVELFKKCVDKKLKEGELPFDIKEVRHAKEPLDSVARGCLLASQLEYPDEE